MAATIWFVMGLCAGYVISMVCMASGRNELEHEIMLLKEQNKRFQRLLKSRRKVKGGTP